MKMQVQCRLQAASGLAVSICMVLVGGGTTATAMAQMRTSATPCSVVDGQCLCAQHWLPLMRRWALLPVQRRDIHANCISAGRRRCRVASIRRRARCHCPGAASNALVDGTSALGAGSLTLERDASAVVMRW
ncbi:hypothetical protein M3O59_21110 [Xanthomonas nasturtii]|uniref:hypothetical protein n=1 Tax=Xanthomonas nasturtii TaxID=1843581 RepID=UPI00358E6272